MGTVSVIPTCSPCAVCRERAAEKALGDVAVCPRCYDLAAPRPIKTPAPERRQVTPLHEVCDRLLRG